MNARDVAAIILASGVALVLAAFAVTILTRGGAGKIKFGGSEMSINTALAAIREDTQAINRAVNHQGPDEPPMIERVIGIERSVEELRSELADARAEASTTRTLVSAHLTAAAAWQDAIREALPDSPFPAKG